MEVLEEMLLLIATLSLLFYVFLRQKFNYWVKRGVPFEEPNLIFGNLTDVIFGRTSVGHRALEVYKKFEGPFIGYYNFCSPALMLKDSELIKLILIKDFNKFQDVRFAADEKADSVASHFLFGMKNPPWKTYRMRLSPAFTSGRLKLMFPLIKECLDDLIEYLSENTGEVIEMKETAGKFTTDVICSCAFGIKVNAIKSENPELVAAAKKVFNFDLRQSLCTLCYFTAPILVHIFKLRFIEKKASDFLKNVFWENVRNREMNNFKRNDLIDLLINWKNEDSSTLENDVLPAQAITFFSAGQETSSSTVAFALYELCLNLDCQERLREEIKENINESDSVSYENLLEMKYLEAVILETLRKYPFAPFVNRIAREDYKIPGYDVMIEKGGNIFIPLLGIHMDPKYYQDPEKFNPDRFYGENKQALPQGAYLPFGDGPRRCLGERFALLSVKIALFYILKNFEVLRCKETTVPIELDPRAALSRSKNGVKLKLRRIII